MVGSHAGPVRLMSPPRPAGHRSAVGAALVAGLVAAAVAVRLPYLWEIPRFTDETSEILVALRIVHGQALRLTNADPYDGSLWNYLLAALFLVGGPSFYSPRALVLALGALTAVPTYLLGRSFGGPRAGLLAGALLALSPVHIVVNSHIAWSNCITPLLTTLGLWLLHRAVVEERPSGLLRSGLAFGLALQTHPTVALLLPAVVLYSAWARPAWLRSRWPYLATALALVAYGNVLVANLADGLAGLEAGRAAQAHYAAGEALSPEVYGRRLIRMLGLLTNGLGGLLSESDPLAGPSESPIVAWVALLTVAGLVLAARRGNPLPLLACLSVALTMPLAVPRYESVVPKARYLGYLLPPCFAAMAFALVGMSSGAGRLGHWGRFRLAPLARAAAALGMLATLAAPLWGLGRFYQQALEQGRTDTAAVQTIRAVQAERRPDESVYFDDDLASPYSLGGGRLLRTLNFAGTIYGWPSQTVDLLWASASGEPAGPALLVVHAGNEALAAQAYLLESIPTGPPLNPPVEVFRSKGPRPRGAADIPSVPSPASPRTERVVSGLQTPTGLAFAPDGRLFFAEASAGRVRIVEGGALRAEPFAVLPISTGRDQGALGLALHPGFATNRWIYVFYSEGDGRGRPVRNRVVRFTERNGLATEPTPILDDLPINRRGFFNGGHNGGRLAFGPDGKLYVSVGEAAERGTAQDPSALNGKVLRVGADGSVPDDNPFPGLLPYAVGLSNVLGMAFHPATGGLYAADRGLHGHDELDLVLAGRDYGYPEIEGKGGAPYFEDPIWDSGEERPGVTGLAFYSGSLFPEYHGDLFFCAFTTGELRRARLSGPGYDQVERVESVAQSCRLDVAIGPDGAVYFSDLTDIYRLVP